MAYKPDSVYDNEEALVRALKAGDAGAYGFLMDRYHHKLCLYAYKFCNNHELAADIVQNIMLRLWRKRNKLRSDSSVRSLLYRSVYNEFLDQYQHYKFITNLEAEYVKTLDHIADEDNEDFNQLVRQVNDQIEKLPPKCREIFLLSKKEGLTNKEIAKHLKVSIKTVENQITRAYKSIRNNIEKPSGDFL